MIAWHLILSVLIALPLVLVFSLMMGRPGPWGTRNSRSGLLLFFVIVFLATWAGGIWLNPFGPRVWGIPWASFLFAGIAASLLIAALGPSKQGHTVAHAPYDGIRGPISYMDTGAEVLFWILLVGLILAIVAGYAIKSL